MTRILVVKLDHIGDMAMALPAVKALADHAKADRIDFVVSSCNLGWKEVLPWAGKFYAVDFPGYSKDRTRKPSRLYTLVSLIVLTARLRRSHYDVAIDLRSVANDWRGKIIAWLSGAPKRIGLRGSGQSFLTTAVEDPDGHQSESFVRRLRCVAPDIEPTLHGVVELGGMSRPRQPVVLLHPGAGTPSKLWPESNWIEVARRLASTKPPIQCRFLGSRVDEPRIRRICQSAGPMATGALIGQTLAESLRAIAESSLLVGLDSAAVHMAALVDTPAITIFSAANDPERWRALGRNTVLHHRIDCGLCRQYACRWPFHRCMDAITPDHVVRAIIVAMQPRPPEYGRGVDQV